MRRSFYAFLVCIIISTALWFLIRLTGEFKQTVIYPVTYTHLYKDKIIINQPDKFLSITYKVKGFDIPFTNYANKKKTLVINLSRFTLIKEGEEYKALIYISRYSKQISEQLNLPEESITISPDTVLLNFMDICQKKVPVKLNLSLSFEKQFDLYKPVVFKPDSIIVSGTKRNVEKINYIETQFKFLKNLKRNEYITLNLIKPKCTDKVSISSEKTYVLIPIEKYTEGNVTIPVTVLHSLKGKSLKTFPDKVDITYLVALKDYNKVNPAMFEAAVNYLNPKETKNKKIKIHILNHPEFTRITKVKPDKVEFFIW